MGLRHCEGFGRASAGVAQLGRGGRGPAGACVCGGGHVPKTHAHLVTLGRSRERRALPSRSAPVYRCRSQRRVLLCHGVSFPEELSWHGGLTAATWARGPPGAASSHTSALGHADGGAGGPHHGDPRLPGTVTRSITFSYSLESPENRTHAPGIRGCVCRRST